MWSEESLLKATELGSEPNPVYACIAVQELTFACLREKKKATNRYKSVNDLLVCSRESQTYLNL